MTELTGTRNSHKERLSTGRQRTRPNGKGQYVVKYRPLRDEQRSIVIVYGIE
jgi:hypothetical protein